MPAAAAARLDTTLLPFLLFADPATGQARLLYRRYDGDYSLLIPMNDAATNHGVERANSLDDAAA
ncbi:sigma 54 modulation/S30EA ribosomal C-terminal domain-containing protein [Actinospica sp.]|uniref:sigma 54 modulation/S30EA ribosomal C-terminal domain-containing protein n=1 Tax=Actinospica sp. TaxID=1872142 RepID=UPI002C416638|nr:sigma 54 modulation/S30EA ribosomal C-terminal domain-containing protein [Actinospica sp.]HWG26778.1 sigma 54 modulation/S30EA ribosomal C-terminal domain-containing protein [Actinospica sp.]